MADDDDVVPESLLSLSLSVLVRVALVLPIPVHSTRTRARAGVGVGVGIARIVIRPRVVQMRPQQRIDSGLGAAREVVEGLAAGELVVAVADRDIYLALLRLCPRIRVPCARQQCLRLRPRLCPRLRLGLCLRLGLGARGVPVGPALALRRAKVLLAEERVGAHGGARERVRGRERGARRGELGGGRVRALEVRCVNLVYWCAVRGVPRVAQCARLVHALRWVGCGGCGIRNAECGMAA